MTGKRQVVPAPLTRPGSSCTVSEISARSADCTTTGKNQEAPCTRRNLPVSGGAWVTSPSVDTKIGPNKTVSAACHRIACLAGEGPDLFSSWLRASSAGRTPPNMRPRGCGGQKCPKNVRSCGQIPATHRHPEVNSWSGRYLPFPQSQLETGLPPSKPEPTLDVTRGHPPRTPKSRYRGLHGEQAFMPMDERVGGKLAGRLLRDGVADRGGAQCRRYECRWICGWPAALCD